MVNSINKKANNNAKSYFTVSIVACLCRLQPGSAAEYKPQYINRRVEYFQHRHSFEFLQDRLHCSESYALLNCWYT